MLRIVRAATAVAMTAFLLFGESPRVCANDNPTFNAEQRRLASEWERVKLQIQDRNE